MLHVAFLSLHVAMTVALALSGGASASQSRLGFVICELQHVTPNDVASNPAQPNGKSSGQNTAATFCPVCIGAAALALVPPEGPPLPAYVALEVPIVVAVTPAIETPRHETERKRSRAPPRLT